MPTRRSFLTLLAAGGSAMLAQQPLRIVRSARPEDLEMPMEGFLQEVTSIEQFFVRSHTMVPQVDLSSWKLHVKGHVQTPLQLSMEDLRRMPSRELVGVLECAGNGRSFYNPPVAGIQWTNGAVSNGRWRGVRLADVLKRAGVKSGTVEIAFDGADVPLGAMADFQRSIPLAKALHPDTLLAYELNGQTLPQKHGFPLRAVVPGWAGDSWVKWITSIQVLDRELDGFWMKSAYLYPNQPVTPGSTVPATSMSPVTSLRVKSVIASPREEYIQVGRSTVIRGAAWGGDRGPVSAVDVSSDDGQTWQPAKLMDRQSPYGWRRWEFSWTPKEARTYWILARARDATGATQPLVPEWNPSGYLWNVAPREIVPAVSGPTPRVIGNDLVPVRQVPPSGFQQTCLVCHGDDVIRQQRLTRAQWDREITKMTGWGARLSAEQRAALLDYLSSTFGVR